MIKIKEQRVEGDYLITEYENGTIIKSLVSEEPAPEPLEPPTNPILELQKENADLQSAVDFLMMNNGI